MRKNNLIIMLIVLLAGSLMVSGCAKSEKASPNETNQPKVHTSLRVYSGAGLSKPMDEIAKVFEEKENIKIELVYGGSSQNLSQIELSRDGDVWTPGSMADCDVAEGKGLIANKKEIVYHIPIIAVPKGNPARIQSLEDLGKEGIKVVLGDEESCAIGKVSVKLLAENGLKERVASNTLAKTANVSELLVYMQLKQADAAIIWEDEAIGNQEIDVIKIPKEINQIKTVPVAVLKTTKQMKLAQQFADFVASEEGLKIFSKYGFKPIE